MSNEASQDDLNRFAVNNKDTNTLEFVFETKDDASSLLLPRAHAFRYSDSFRDMFSEDTRQTTIECGEEIASITVLRLISCISPTLRSNLPTHDVRHVCFEAGPEVVTSPIQWTMPALQDLYLLAHSIKMYDVCDIIIDRWHQGIHTPARASRSDLDMLDIEPAFLHYLEEHDARGFSFLVDMMAAKGHSTLKLLNNLGLSSWSEGVKASLIETLESNAYVPIMGSDHETLCKKYHQHHIDGKSCYKSRSTNTCPTLPQERAHPDPSQRSVFSARQNELAQYQRRRAIQLALLKKGQQAKKQAQSHLPSEQDSEDEKGDQKRLVDWNQSDNEHDQSSSEDNSEDSDDSEANGNNGSVTYTLNLPPSYTTERGYTIIQEDVSESEEHYELPLTGTDLRDLGADHMWFDGKHLNRRQVDLSSARAQIQTITEKLEIFEQAGYDVFDKQYDAGSNDEEEGNDDERRQVVGDDDDNDDNENQCP